MSDLVSAPVIKRRRPQCVEMMPVEANNLAYVATWSGGRVMDDRGISLRMQPGNQRVDAVIGEWVIRGVDGTFYPATAENIAAGYEDVL